MSVECGHVYCLHFLPAGKEKLLVPAYILPDDRVRFFVINSELTQYQQDNAEVSQHILRLPQNLNQQFLTHDSWLTCHELAGGWTVGEINALNGHYRGPLDQATLGNVRTVITGSRLYSQVEKNRILARWP